MINRVIISGGGTGGHIFPAIAIADEIKRRFPEVSILFIGAEGRMEMEKIPQAGYSIQGLRIAGFKRSLAFSNFLLPFKIIGSMLKARKIIKSFNPEIVIGVGGYASGPTLKVAAWLGIKTLIQEQNSFPGKTNLLLAKKASLICTAYADMDKFFPSEKIMLTGNPIRKDIVDIESKKTEAYTYYNLDPSKKTILIIGGSLGARTLNEAVENELSSLAENREIQMLWQCGKLYFDQISERVSLPEQVKLNKFIDRMDLAYAAADLIISRAGATSISELCIVAKPLILVPSPNVSEDHQTKNAMSLVNIDAAVLIKDSQAKDHLLKKAFEILADSNQMSVLSKNCSHLGKPNATKEIVDAVQSLIN